MKKKDKDTLLSLDVAELKQKLIAAQTLLEKTQLEKTTVQTKNSRASRKIRKQIAFMQTKIREKELIHE